MGLAYVDTGAMYRAVALNALRQGIPPDDRHGLATLAREGDLTFVVTPDGYRTYLNGEDVTEAIREPTVSRIVSVIAAVPEVRHHLVRLQRQLAACGGVVMEGRDIGTFVLPWADKKFFITASVQERARRRQQDLRRKGIDIPFPELLREIEERDRLDRSRPVGPLSTAADALVIDTTGRSIREVVDLVVREVTKG